MSSDARGPSGRRRPARGDNTAGGKKVRPGYHHGDLRAALLKAADALIRERGVGELSLREVARRAEVSHGAPAHHFRNKAGLLTAFAAQGFERLLAQVTALPAYRAAGSGPDQLAATGRGYVRFALANPAHFAIMFDSAEVDTADPAFETASNQAYALLTRAIERCVREGRLPPGQVGAATVAAWSLVHGFACLWTGGRLGQRSGTARASQLADDMIDLFVARLMAGPA